MSELNTSIVVILGLALFITIVVAIVIKAIVKILKCSEDEGYEENLNYMDETKDV